MPEIEQSTSSDCEPKLDALTDFQPISEFTIKFHIPVDLNNVPMFAEDTPELWFKVLEAVFDEIRL